MSQGRASGRHPCITRLAGRHTPGSEKRHSHYPPRARGPERQRQRGTMVTKLNHAVATCHTNHDVAMYAMG